MILLALNSVLNWSWARCCVLFTNVSVVWTARAPTQVEALRYCFLIGSWKWRREIQILLNSALSQVTSIFDFRKLTLSSNFWIKSWTGIYFSRFLVMTWLPIRFLDSLISSQLWYAEKFHQSGRRTLTRKELDVWANYCHWWKNTQKLVVNILTNIRCLKTRHLENCFLNGTKSFHSLYQDWNECLWHG